MTATLSHELGYLTVRHLSILLDHESPQGRDWMGLADKMGFTYHTVYVLKRERSPTRSLLEEWEKAAGTEATVANLICLLDSLDCKEAVEVLKKGRSKCSLEVLKKGRKEKKTNVDIETSLSKVNIQDTRPSNKTVKEQQCGATCATPSHDLSAGRESKVADRGTKKKQPTRSRYKYDVFLSYAEEDKEFAEEMRERLANTARLRVFVPSDGLLAGKVFHQEIAAMINKDCRKIVVILSPDYIKSPWCNYEANLALMVSPDARKHKLVPVLYKKCDIPAFLAPLYYCNYPRHQGNKLECESYFWKKLYDSLNYIPTDSVLPKGNTSA